jgi:hypothetical protein
MQPVHVTYVERHVDIQSRLDLLGAQLTQCLRAVHCGQECSNACSHSFGCAVRLLQAQECIL